MIDDKSCNSKPEEMHRLIVFQNEQLPASYDRYEGEGIENASLDDNTSPSHVQQSPQRNTPENHIVEIGFPQGKTDEEEKEDNYGNVPEELVVFYA